MTVQTQTQSDSRGVDRVAVAITGILFLGFVGLMLGYARMGDAWVDELPGRIGEIWMERGVRLERAGDLDGATVMYERSLDARYQSSSNRARTLRRLVALVEASQGAEAAEPFRRELEEHRARSRQTTRTP